MTDLFAGGNVKDLCAAVAASSHESPVMTEPNAANHALVRKIVHEIDIKSTMHTWIEHCMPVLALTLEMRRELVRLEIGQLVADAFEVCVSILEIWCELRVAGRWGRTCDAWRTWIWVGLALLRSGGPA